MTAKFRVGQVVMWVSSKKVYPVMILEVIDEYGIVYYRYDKKNCLSESMLRALTSDEAGWGDRWKTMRRALGRISVGVINPATIAADCLAEIGELE